MPAERIHELCKELLETSEPEEVSRIAEELQRTIHERVETLRQDLAALSAFGVRDSENAA